MVEGLGAGFKIGSASCYLCDLGCPTPVPQFAQMSSGDDESPYIIRFGEYPMR